MFSTRALRALAHRSPLVRLQCLSLSGAKKKVVFMGTPEVAAMCLDMLLAGASAGPYEVVSVVTQPPAPVGRHRKLTNTPVHDLALEKGIPVLHPESASDPLFAFALENLQADLFVTAAYGQYLPKRILAASKHGTVNIHPSLLPKYRGAAPVQRCLENGDPETGVTLLFSVKKMDAGPIVDQLLCPLQGDEKAPEVLRKCFEMGTRALIEKLPHLVEGAAVVREQEHSHASAAPKLSTADSLVDFAAATAQTLHNRCRGYAKWPGIHAFFHLGGAAQATRINIITTRLLAPDSTVQLDRSLPVGHAQYSKALGLLLIRCAEDSYLGVSELQPQNKKVMTAAAFRNGVQGAFRLAACDPPALAMTPAPAAPSPVTADLSAAG